MQIDDQKLRQVLIADPKIPEQVPPGLTLAAVLVTIHRDQGEDWLLLTRRTEHLRKHKGQIAFPGGKFDQGEDLCLQSTALRESWEEVGLMPQHVNILGSLEAFDTVSSYLLYPFVGRFNWPYELQVNSEEISELIRVPLSHLLDPGCYHSTFKEYKGEQILVHYYEYGHHTIWGITGFILHEFLKRLTE